MITIQAGKMIIPEEERFVGFAGDDHSCTKQFILKDAVDSGCIYALYLRFDDDRVTSASLTAAAGEGGVILTWDVSAAHLLKAGIVMAQLKITDGNNEVTHSSWDYFVVGASAELADDGSEVDILRRSQLDAALALKADKATTIADLPLSGDISAAALYESIAFKINPPLITVGRTPGVTAQYGRTVDDEPVFCEGMDTWVLLARRSDLPTKTSDLTNDSGFLTQHQSIAGKEDNSNKVASLSASSTHTQYPSAKCVYDLIGDVESLLSQI